MNKYVKTSFFILLFFIIIGVGILISPFIAFFIIDFHIAEQLVGTVCVGFLESKLCASFIITLPIFVLCAIVTFIFYKKKKLICFYIMSFFVSNLIGTYFSLVSLSNM